MPEFKGRNTTTEFLARVIFDRDRRGHSTRRPRCRGARHRRRSRDPARIARRVGRLRRVRSAAVDVGRTCISWFPGDPETTDRWLRLRSGDHLRDCVPAAGPCTSLSVPGAYPVAVRRRNVRVGREHTGGDAGRGAGARRRPRVRRAAAGSRAAAGTFAARGARASSARGWKPASMRLTSSACSARNAQALTSCARSRGHVALER